VVVVRRQDDRVKGGRAAARRVAAGGSRASLVPPVVRGRVGGSGRLERWPPPSPRGFELARAIRGEEGQELPLPEAYLAGAESRAPARPRLLRRRLDHDELADCCRPGEATAVTSTFRRRSAWSPRRRRVRGAPVVANHPGGRIAATLAAAGTPGPGLALVRARGRRRHAARRRALAGSRARRPPRTTRGRSLTRRASATPGPRRPAP